jgi:hypothetical protein
MAVKFFLRLFIFFALFAGLSLIFTPSASGTGGTATQPFIFDGTVRSMVKQPGYVGSTYNVESKD